MSAEHSEPLPQKKKKEVLVVASSHKQAAEETFAGFLRHCYRDKIHVTETDNFEAAADLLFPKFDHENAKRQMSEIELPKGAYFKIGQTRFGHHIHVFEESDTRINYRDHIAVGLAVESIERRNRLPPFHTVITEKTIPLRGISKSVSHYFGLSLISLAQMASVPRIGILVPKGSQEVRHYLGDIRCGETRLVLCFNQDDWHLVSRELIGV